MRNEILKLRNDPTANAVMAGAFTQSNADMLKEQLGRAPSEPELYIAHFLGAPGAARLIGLAASNPNAKAADFFPGAAQANSPIFYDRPTGRARSLAQVRDVLTARYDVARARPSRFFGNSGCRRRCACRRDGSDDRNSRKDRKCHRAGYGRHDQRIRLGDSGRATGTIRSFNGLFQDPDRTGPVAAVVSELWGVPNGSRQGGASMFDLFKDFGPEILTRRFARKCTSPPLISWQPSQRFMVNGLLSGRPSIG